MHFTRNVRITFTPEARALLGPRESWNTSAPHSFPTSCNRGDFVRFPGCNATFLVLGRWWTLEDDQETIEVVLDRLDDEPQLRPV